MIDEQTLDRLIEFHGHLCPGLAMGVHAAELALREIGPHARDEEVVAIVETDMCAVDAIQFMTGCTFGKGNLVHRDYGKNAYTFYGRDSGRGVRIRARPRAWQRDPEHQRLFTKVLAGEGSDDERARLWELHGQESRRILERSPDDVFEVHEVNAPPPPKAQIHASVACVECGEETMETKTRRVGGRELCPECFERALADTSD